MWSDNHPTEAGIEWLVYPRACALAEAVWSPREGREYHDFYRRMAVHQQRLAALGVHYRPLVSMPAPAPVAGEYRLWSGGDLPPLFGCRRDFAGKESGEKSPHSKSGKPRNREADHEPCRATIPVL